MITGTLPQGLELPVDRSPPGQSEAGEVVRITRYLMVGHRDRTQLFCRHPFLDDLAGGYR